MLKTLKLTDSGDIEFNRRIQPTTLLGEDAVNQIVKSAFSLWQGNWFRDIERGVDWLNILKKLYNRQTIIQILSSAILKLDFIDEVIDMYISLKTDSDERRVAEIFYLIVAEGNKILGSVET